MMIHHMPKKLAVICITLFVFLLPNVTDGKVLPRYRGVAPQTRSSGVVISPRLRSDRQAILLYVGNVASTSSVVYTLTYETNGKQEGAYGSIDSSAGNAVTRELLFGTCSNGVCRYHQNLANMKLEVTAEYLNGKRVTRRYRVRI